MYPMMSTAVTAMAAGLIAVSAIAQAPAASAPPPASRTVSAQPVAIPARIAVVDIERVVFMTNEGQRVMADIGEKYKPQKVKIDAQAKEVDALKTKLQALPTGASNDQRSALLKDIGIKQKQLQLDAETAQSNYNDDIQKAYDILLQKVGKVVVKYCTDNGYTLLLNIDRNQQAAPVVIWPDPRTDITQAIVDAYNIISGVSPPPAEVPSAPHSRPNSTSPQHR